MTQRAPDELDILQVYFTTGSLESSIRKRRMDSTIRYMRDNRRKMVLNGLGATGVIMGVSQYRQLI